MFDPVDPKQSLPALEEGILRYWKEEDTFKRSLKQRSTGTGDLLDGPMGQKQETYSFYDGPPFATGLPHYGHLLAGTIKDVIPRYQTMRGKYVERRFGWDCHGLPVENIIEQEKGIKSHKEIEEMGIAAFNGLCRTAVQRYAKEWRTVVERMGRWVDMDWDYRTMDPEYMESIWWVFSELAKKDLIYEGHKPMHICPRCVTPLSNFEVTQGYKDITDTSVTVKFELADEPGTFILAWTTTPWTLPGNLLLAVDPHIKYVKYQYGCERYILAKKIFDQRKDPKNLLHPLLYAKAKREGEEIEENPESVEDISIKTLLGKRYIPLFPYFQNQKEYANAYRIVGADFVTADEGTGIVHIAPGFGEDDYNLGKKEKLPVLQHVNMEGKFVSEVTDFAGMEVKPIADPGKTDRLVTKWLKEHGKLFDAKPYTHSYPHCWRCDSPLLNYATSSWFVSVEKIKEDVLAANAETEWVPAHIRDGRFGKWLEGARDWAISRNRYWGTPLPIWRCPETKDMTVIASREELTAQKKLRFTKVTALRHGESEGNLVPVYQGKEPGTNLTAKGKEQARKAADYLNTAEVTAIYCSPLARTRQTAEAIAKKTGAPVIVDPRLCEVCFGDYEGKTVDFSDLTFVKARRAHKLSTATPESIYHFPGMEKWSDVAQRMRAFMEDVLPLHRGGHIVLVTHADPIQNIRHFFSNEDPVKLSHQPYPFFATPYTFYWDHEAGKELDLHKHIVDEITWNAGSKKTDTLLTVVRHGQTDYNKQDLVNGGNIDTLLNETGREQVHALAKKLKKRKFDVIISSDLKRAVETAEILSAELKVPHTARWKELRERDTGDWTGKPVKDFITLLPRSITASPALHPGTPPGGESLQAFLQRLETVLEKIRAEFPGKRVLVACHSGPLRGLQAIVDNLSFAEAAVIDPKNAETTDLALPALMHRIPEVLDCWFESGSMPYAQSHFPFDFAQAGKGKKSPPGFPADFIAEGIDQTRGWFYTLMILSSALFKKPAFFNCIVNGIVLAEDGKKMSKRLKNYPEPTEVVNRHGADAVRFTFMSSPAVRGEDLRFSEKLVEETVRSVLLPLWNVYSFFVTYANAAGFEPTGSRGHSGHPLDRYLRAEVQDLVNRMTKQLDGYDLSAACAEIHETIDALTNWYVRLSRRIFAGKGAADEEDTSPSAELSEHDAEQAAALGTLYDALLTLCQTLAPFCPFLTEAIYLNLVPEAHTSIHLSDWPEPRALTAEEWELLKRNRLMRHIVSLGHAIRSGKKIKVRQPLARATVALPPSLAALRLTEEDRDLLKNELNVKDLEFTDDPGTLACRIAQVDARKVGPRLGARVQEIIRAGKSGAFTVKEDGSVLILDEVLAPDEVAIVYRGKEGQDAAVDQGIVVCMETAITEELKREGLARDVIRAVQKLRKEAGLHFTDRIALSMDGLADVQKEHGAAIAQETNALWEQNDGEAQSVTIDGTDVTVRLQKR
ncbi:MAG: isoleucyl-tRNA synthetase [Candidatus Peribacter riflensis]|uniref:Isoleucine--tRNA ligase n=1 Tax=Candidatus Peribacter riflensis TaxID=1735162 RepID=A0A0S1SIR3_9BACT|nr:MAG: isoleucyl-tRNA synthetase [Candidatus Peribacter riflensis]ALM10636.1 MAG: Isoleucyl-tRNA synthetase [Candidatus Peribacter riflensis]ALM11738.1 MAG: isoleucyl-tRNA synthetase [Candidatus Peribacter riflensis]ALM12841.1 MAG: isoleucyl-tRNA synthetase [Candidatus Peribacter riflensis]ALM13942.1 MAG: isoleucyl-tRNA synthetase [Candidatus Peribacter riflensis]